MMKNTFLKRLPALILALILVPLCVLAEDTAPASEENASVPEEPSAFDLTIDSKFRSFSRCGEVVIAKDGEIVYQRCYGFANPKKTIPVTPDHYYRLASVSKLVTATGVMRLVDQGKWDLDENIGTYLGGETPFFAASPYYRKTGINTRMLMTHTSCIWADKFSSQYKPTVTRAYNVKKNNKTYFYKDKPGTQYHYSNYGGGTIGCMIEAITGKRLDDAMSELIFDPMGLDAGYVPDVLQDPSMITSEVVRTYSGEVDIDHDYIFSYGSCWMKCADLCRLGMMLCDYGLYSGERILSEESVREMISSQKGKGGITIDPIYGLNVQRLSIPPLFGEKMIYGHQGMIDNILCALYFEPESRYVYAMVSVSPNVANRQGRTYSLRALAYNLLKLTWNEFGNK